MKCMEKGVKFLKNTSRTGHRRDRTGVTGEDENSFDDIGLGREAGLQQDPYSASGHSNSSRRSTIGSASSSLLPSNVPATPMMPFPTSPQPQQSPYQHRPHDLPRPSQIVQQQQQQQQQQQHQAYGRQLPSISHIIATAAPPGRGTAVTTH